MKRRALARPPSYDRESKASSPSSMKDWLRSRLSQQFSLSIPSSYIVVVEGVSDVQYLVAASDALNRELGVDLLDLGQLTEEGNDRITICTPTDPALPGNRGGVKWMEKVARFLSAPACSGDSHTPICFVLDHDEAGRKSHREVVECGFNSDWANAITLDPKAHPFCARSQRGEPEVVVEDLVSIHLQERFFRSVPSTCEVCYAKGKIVRVLWKDLSKSELLNFVARNCTAQDMLELIRVLVRIRDMWRLEIPQSVRDFLRHPPRESAGTV